MDVNMVYKPTNTTGGHHPAEKLWILFGENGGFLPRKVGIKMKTWKLTMKLT
jgi:hypothetical protein